MIWSILPSCFSFILILIFNGILCTYGILYILVLICSPSANFWYRPCSVFVWWWIMMRYSFRLLIRLWFQFLQFWISTCWMNLKLMTGLCFSQWLYSSITNLSCFYYMEVQISMEIEESLINEAKIIWILSRFWERVGQRISGFLTAAKLVPASRRWFHGGRRRVRLPRVCQVTPARFPAREAAMLLRHWVEVWKRNRSARLTCAAEPKPSRVSCLAVLLLKWGYVSYLVTVLTPAKPWECEFFSLSLRTT